MRRRALLACAAPALARGDSLAAIERASGGRLGVFAMNRLTDRRIVHRADERFPMMSTFKALLAAAVLLRGASLLERGFIIPQELIPWSPVTESQIGASLSGTALCAAMLETSDNTAANLLLDAVGGPAALTGWLRGIGDATTRLDRIEPDLNTATPGDPRDTTSPAAMARTLARLCLDQGLPAEAQIGLTGWMQAHRFGGPLLRAGMPGWTLADRSGAGGFNSRGVIAVAWPPAQTGPWVIAAYLHGGPPELAARDALLARVGAVVAAAAR